MLPATRTVYAVANWGRWLGRCSRCPSALAVDRFASVFACTECGLRAEILWPPEDMVYAIERLLLMRPDVTTQNWEPGETLPELMWENGAHGIFDGVPGELIVDDRSIRMDTLPATYRPGLVA